MLQVSEVTSFGARTARELSHSVKNIIRNMHSENTVAKLARQSRAVLAGALCSCQCRPEGLNYSFAPLMIAIFYVLGIAALVVSIVVFMIALLRGLEESLPTLGESTSTPAPCSAGLCLPFIRASLTASSVSGVGSMVCLIAGVSSCVLGVATSFVLRALARVELIGEDDESKELEEAVLQV